MMLSIYRRGRVRNNVIALKEKNSNKELLTNIIIGIYTLARDTYSSIFNINS